jgi:hypothetical protein
MQVGFLKGTWVYATVWCMCLLCCVYVYTAEYYHHRTVDSK